MFIRHGSEDFLDKDYCIVIEKPFETIQDLKTGCPPCAYKNRGKDGDT